MFSHHPFERFFFQFLLGGLVHFASFSLGFLIFPHVFEVFGLVYQRNATFDASCLWCPAGIHLRSAAGPVAHPCKGAGSFCDSGLKRLIHMGVSKNRGTQNGWFIMENPIKMDDLGGTIIFGHTHIKDTIVYRFI